MENKLEDLLSKAPEHIKALLTSEETSRIVSSIAHANSVKVDSVPILHTEIVLLMLGLNNIERDREDIIKSLIQGGVSESSAAQIVEDIKNYILPKLQNEADSTEIKKLNPITKDTPVAFVGSKLSPSTIANLSKINTPPIIKRQESPEKIENRGRKLDPYREDVI